LNSIPAQIGVIIPITTYQSGWVEESMAIKVTINGKPAIANKVKNELERSVLDAIIHEVKKTILTTTSFEESQQITLHVTGNDLESLAFDLEGPEEIVYRARAGFN
jgi:hypothetical protein